MQSKLKADYEVIRLHAQKGSNAITFTPQINTTDMRYKQYTQFAYMTFNVMDFGIDEYIANISIQNRQSSRLNRLGTGLKESYPIKEEWLDKQIRFFAFIENPKYEVGVTLYIYSPSLYIEEGLIDVSGYIVGFGAAIGRGLVIKGTKFISEIQGNRYVKKESREMQGIARESLSNKDAREWYVNTQLPKMKELGNRILTLEERAKFHFIFAIKLERTQETL